MEEGIYEVWHVKRDVFEELALYKRPILVAFPRDYEFVARVKARDLEQVFEKTNSHDLPWWQKRGVECLKETRSTMVGDVVISPSREVYQVQSQGWCLVQIAAQKQARATSQEQYPSRGKEQEPAREAAQELDRRSKLLN